MFYGAKSKLYNFLFSLIIKKKDDYLINIITLLKQ